MAYYLGIDTSNYTTSLAVLDASARQVVLNLKRPLTVKSGGIGLRQSDAVFQHIKNLPPLLEEARSRLSHPIAGVGVSVRPRDEEDSYMPCFLSGRAAAYGAALGAGVPVGEFSHQAGHLAAALYSTGRLDLLGGEFIAFHISGGTSECHHVLPEQEHVFLCRLISHSLDLKLGQAIDRVGVAMGLPFPAGPEMDRLAQQSKAVFHPRVTFQGDHFCASGLENLCLARIRAGEKPEDVAKFCLSYVLAVVEEMTRIALARCPGLPLIYAGGVMSNSLIRQQISRQFGGQFAEPAFSADNAAGAAVLAAWQQGGLKL